MCEADNQVPKWPPLFALIAAACSGGLGSAGWHGHRLGMISRQLESIVERLAWAAVHTNPQPYHAVIADA